MTEREAEIARVAGGLTKDGRAFVEGMTDEPRKWSATHGWPSEMDRLICAGLIKRSNTDRWLPRTIPTQLGLALQVHLKSEQANGK